MAFESGICFNLHLSIVAIHLSLPAEFPKSSLKLLLEAFVFRLKGLKIKLFFYPFLSFVLVQKMWTESFLSDGELSNFSERYQSKNGPTQAY